MATERVPPKRPKQGPTVLMAVVPLLGPGYLTGIAVGWWYWAEDEGLPVVFLSLPLTMALAGRLLARSLPTLRAFGAATPHERALAVLAASLNTVSLVVRAFALLAIFSYLAGGAG